MRSWIGLVLLGVVTAGCGGDDDDGVKRRGSPACQDLQDAVCDFGADRCGAIARSSCDAMLSGIECTSDAQASSCANALNTASCGQAVSECNLLQIIDRQPAAMACEQVLSGICQHFLDCGLVPNLQDCVSATASAGFDCTQAIAIGTGFEQCLQQVQSASCSASTPDACRGVVVVLPASAVGIGSSS